MITPHHNQETLPRHRLRPLCLMAALFALLVLLSPNARAAKVLFVTTGAQRDTVKLENILQAQEHALTIHDTAVSGNALTAAEYAAQGYELLIVDEVIGSGAVGDRFRNSPIPVINMEGFLYSNGRSLFNAGTGLTGGTFSNAAWAAQQDLAGVADFGQVQSTTAINIVNPSHPLAAGLPAGQVDVWDPATPPLDADGSGLITFASARTFTTNVQVAATVPGFANGYCVFGVDAGVLNADGTTTNQARWVHLPWNDTDTAERVMIEPSFFLFEAAIAWALELAEPTKIYNLKGGDLDGTNSVIFSVDKLTHSGSAVAQANIGLSLDGVDIPNGSLAIVSNGNQWDVRYTGLLANKDYTAVASATAADGGFSARLLKFNTFPKVTFNPSYYTIEAEDFNFGGGQFFDVITLCNTIGGGTPGCYFDRVGFTNIDKLEINFAQTVVVPVGTETYRFGDTADLIRDEWVNTYLTSDPLVRTQYTMTGISDYEVRSITNGEWLNYTRTIPATNYNIYAQLASSSALRVHMDFVTSGATTTNQTLQSVGDFIRASGTAGAFELVPLTDDSGTNLIVVPFNGTTKTMRFTALSSGYSENFFMFLPTAQQINPIVAITNPPNGALLQEGQQIAVGAEATDPDGTISQVEFFAGTNEPLTSIGVDTVAPYSAQFTPPVLGVFATYTIRAVATDNNNNTNRASINVTARPPSTLPPTGKLADIIWVTFHSNGIPSAGAAGVGFTNAPDKDYTDLLAASGYNVTRYVSTGTPDPAVLNAADLVIIGRSIDSANYQNASATAWNNIAAPIINMSGYTLRNNRLGFVTASTTPVDSTNNITLTVSNPAHPIFAGIALTGGTMNNPFAVAVNYPPGVTAANPPRGISISPDPVDADGTVLATVSAAGNGPVGAMVIAEWPAGVTLTHAGGAGNDTLAGRRLVFLSGTREGVSISSQTAGLFDLTADGTKMFLNAVAYMLHPQPFKVTWVTFHPGDNTPSADAAIAGFTNAPDKAYTDLLTANGYQVTRYVSSATPNPATLNAADVVIIGRSVDSLNYSSAGATAWNNITSPIMVMSGFATRLNRMGFTSGNTTADITNNVTLTVSDPAHYIFHGISLTSGTMNNPFAGLVNYPPGVTFANPPRGLTLNTDSVNAGGTLLATISAAGGGPVGGMVIGEWQAGAIMTHDPSSTKDTLAGSRVVFLSGSREGNGVDSETAGLFDLAPDGAQMFLNAVRYAASRKGPAPLEPLRIERVSVVGGNQLQLNVTGGTGSFIVQMKTAFSDPNWINVSTNSGSSALVTIGAGNGFFRLQAR